MKKVAFAWRLIAVLVPAAVMGALALLLFFSRFGDGIPISVKIGMPIFLYVAFVAFVFTHK